MALADQLDAGDPGPGRLRFLSSRTMLMTLPPTEVREARGKSQVGSEWEGGGNFIDIVMI